VKNLNQCLYYLLMLSILIFGIWFWFKAPCYFIKDFMWGSSQVPARCLIIPSNL